MIAPSLVAQLQRQHPGLDVRSMASECEAASNPAAALIARCRKAGGGKAGYHPGPATAERRPVQLGLIGGSAPLRTEDRVLVGDTERVDPESFMRILRENAPPEFVADYEHFRATGQTPGERDRVARPPRTPGH